MPADFEILAVKDGGLVDNPKGPGQLQRQYVSVKAPDGTETSDVYLRRKPENAATVGSIVFGELEKNDQGWRLFPKQRDGAGNFKAPKYEREGDPQAERSRRIERQHSQDMAIRALALYPGGVPIPDSQRRTKIKEWTDWFAQDLDADVGGGSAGVSDEATVRSTGTAAADVSADPGNTGTGPRLGRAVLDDTPEEASPAQKGKLTQMFHAAGLSRDAMKAIVLYRCRSERATKEGASQLITDLTEGATHDQLLAEIYDAKRAGDPLATRAAALIPSETPWEDDGSLPPAEVKDDEQVPF
jgi:hypothetical protein